MNDTNPATNPLYRYQDKDRYKQVTDNGQKEGVNVAFTNSLNPPSTEGRFPANIIFECTCDNVIKGEKGEKLPANREIVGKSNFLANQQKSGEHYTDTGDIHTDPNCPCYQLDEQSGISKSTPDNRKEKKVAFVCPFDLDRLTGTPIRTKNTIESVKLFSHVRIIATAGSSEVESVGRVRIGRFIVRAVKSLRNYKPDIIHGVSTLSIIPIVIYKNVS